VADMPVAVAADMQAVAAVVNTGKFG
jgi:hypothetical protein